MTTTATQAEADARALLTTTWWVTPEEEHPLPVDPMAIAKRLGIAVIVAFMPADVSGSIQRRAGAANIYLNAFDSSNRQRFTCAHEVGHYRKRVAEGRSDFTFTDHRSTLASAGVDPDEIWANQFAAAMLMPAHLVQRWYRDGLGASEMAKLLGTSAQAMSLRLRNLRLV